jgi:catechol-2,3-dioxygenase
MCPIPEEGKDRGGIEAVFISAVVVRALDAVKLTEFYKDVLGLPLVETDHEGDGVKHFECDLGDVHFAIYPGRPQSDVESNIRFALAVASLDSILNNLQRKNISPMYPPVDRGFANMTAFRDPEGNVVELTELTPWWLGHLSERPTHLRDVVHSHGSSRAL